MSNILLASNNAVDSGATWYGDQDSSPFLLTQLADPNFSKIWRKTPGTNADGNMVKFAVSLATVARLNHLALCRHNFSEAAQIRVRAGTARLDVDFTDEAGLTSPYLTFGGGTNGTRTNEYGVMVSGTCPRYEHDRRLFENGVLSSEDLGPTGGWSSDSVYRYPDGQTVDFTKASSSVNQALTALRSLPAGTYEMKAQVRLVSGDGSFAFQLFDGQNFLLGSTNVATSDWKWFSSSLVSTGPGLAANSYAYILKQVAAGVLQIRRIQVRSGASNGKYTKTTNQRRYQRRGLIVESGNTNKLLRSAELSNATWLKTAGATVTADQALAPDGAVAMDRLAVTVNAAYTYQDFADSGTTLKGTSVYFRKDAAAATDVALYCQWQTGGVSASSFVQFNAQTATVISHGATGPCTYLTCGVVDVGGGFYRAYLVSQGTDAANTSVRVAVQIGTAGNYVDLWGAQCETSYVTSYIPTTTAAVSRVTDTAVVEATTWVPYAWNGNEATIYHESMANEIVAGTVGNLASLYFRNASGTEGILIQMYEDGSQIADLLVQVTTGGTGFSGSSTAITRGAVARQAIRHRAGDFKWNHNGITSGTITAPNGSTFTILDLMQGPSSTGYLRRVTVWPTGRSDAELQALATTGPSAIDYDSGWSDALQMTPYTQLPALWGYDYDVIKSFTDRAVEWIRVGIYDPVKTSSSTPFEIGRLFTGKVKMQPGVNPSYGLADSWDDATTYAQTQSRRRIFNVLPKLRQVAFELGKLSLSEGDAAHEFDGLNGLSTEVLYLPDPSDEAKCQRYGFVGLMETLDALRWPLMNLRSKAYQITDKR
jgi:hypothetical protein